MWCRISLLFLVLCLFTEDICCGGSEDDNHDNTDKHFGHGRPPIPGMDSSHERPSTPCIDPNHEGTPIPDIHEHEEWPSIPDNLGGEDKHENENANLEGYRVGKMLIVVIVVCVLVMLIFGTCGICILKKCYQDKIKPQSYQDTGMMEKHQIAFTSPVIYPDNPPPYTPTKEFLGYGNRLHAPEIVNVPPSNTKLVDQALQTEPQY